MINKFYVMLIIKSSHNLIIYTLYEPVFNDIKY